MTNLLIHSMAEFSDIILGCLEFADARHIVEIGAEHGGMSFELARYAAGRDGLLTSIDPAPKPAFIEWAKDAPNVRHVAQPSLEALPDIRDVDAWTVDGDHNWYTVYHELKAIDAACIRDGKPLLAFLHDVSWPTARRDMYYAPERIPEQYRQPYDYEGGVNLDSGALMPGRGFRGCGHFAFATHEGGPRNGVLTAVEDFINDLGQQDRKVAWAFVPAVFGLGVLFDVDAPWSASVAQLLTPFHENRLLESLEVNRVRNYLTVIEWQDRAAAAEPGGLGFAVDSAATSAPTTRS